MTKDIELLISVRGVNQNLTRQEAVKKVANELGLSPKSVSGRVTRAEKTIKGRAVLMQWKQDNALHVDRASEDIQVLVNRHMWNFVDHRARLPQGKSHYAVFLSDTHFPYHDVKALELAYKIIADLPGVAYISGLSDGFDLSTLSRWPDGRQARDRALDSDLSGVLDMYCYHLDTLRQIAPKAFIPALIGNHDVRLVSGKDGIENYMQLEVMKKLAGHGLKFLTDFSRENIFKINKYLYWYHGKHARANRVGGAKANYEHVKHALHSKHDFTLVFGHVHDPVHYQNMHANAYGSGCLCSMTPHYSRHVQHWQQGIVVSKFAANWNLTYNINFDNLKAFNPFNGNTYEV